ncbi:MAG: uridine monophosphate kinase [Ruminococcus callidus]
MKPKYHRVLLKLSGEALAGRKTGLDAETMLPICKSIKVRRCRRRNGHRCRRRQLLAWTFQREHGPTRADHIGMLATTMNALAVADMLESLGLEVRVQTAISMQQIAEPYIRNRAISHLKKGRVVIFGCGTGSPFFSTDTAATLRAVEIEADILLKATMVDGVYDKDPHKYDDAVRYSRLTFSDVLGSALQVMDSTAASMCRDNKMPMLVFDLNRPENIYDAVMGEDIGTVVSEVDPIATEV